MAKAESKNDKQAGEIPLSLNEFCASLSKNDRRVELIGGFYSTEKAAGRMKDTRTAYQHRYDAFINAPA